MVKTGFVIKITGIPGQVKETKTFDFEKIKKRRQRNFQRNRNI